MTLAILFSFIGMGIGLYCLIDGYDTLKRPVSPAKIRVNFISTYNSNSHITGGITFFSGLFFVIAVPFFLYEVYETKKEKEKQAIILAPFDKFVSDNIQKLSIVNSIDSSTALYIKKKLIPINAITKKIDESYFKMPDNIRATSINEIGTSLCIFYKNDTLVSYDNYSYSIQRSCKIQIIDLEGNKEIYEGVFMGSPPKTPETKTSKSDDLGGDPIDKVISFIESTAININ